MVRASDKIRNVAFVGLSRSGKTTLLETILAKSGAVARPGRVDEGSSTLDHEDTERERRHSVDPHLCFFEKDGILVNAADTPGYRDFVGNVFGPLVAVEAVVFVVDADEGVRPHTRKLWGYVADRGLPRLVVINRMDRDNARFAETLESLRSLDAKCVPLTVPVGSGPALGSVEWTFGPRKGSSEAAQKGAESFIEALVETDEALLEKYLGGETIAPEALEARVVGAFRESAIFPVLATSALKDVGIAELIEALLRFAPPPGGAYGRVLSDAAKPDEVLALPGDVNQPLLGFVFRSISDPFVGKLTLLRIFAGKLAHNDHFTNPHTGKQEKVGKIVRLQGKDQVPVEAAGAGDIVALVKLEGLRTFDTISANGQKLVIKPPRMPTPMYSRAVEPKTRTDEKKFSESLVKVTEEDPSVVAQRDSRTHEMVVSGLSQLHVMIVLQRLKTRYHVEVNVKDPKIPYLETITAKGDERYRHKKQSGGAGEFGEVALRIEPTARGKGFEWENEVFGGAISEGYVQSAFKGVKAVLEEGAVAGYPMVDIRVVVYDGKDHPVDSKDVAFQKAGREAFKLAVQKAKPVLLEPIVNLEVTFPAAVVGDITGDLNRRRARVQGMDTQGDFQVLKAIVPLAELGDYSNSLGAMTAGQGSYEVEMSHYEVTPGNVQQKIIEQHKAQLAAAAKE